MDKHILYRAVDSALLYAQSRHGKASWINTMHAANRTVYSHGTSSFRIAEYLAEVFSEFAAVITKNANTKPARTSKQ